MRQQKGRPGASPLTTRHPATRKVGTRRPPPPPPPRTPCPRLPARHSPRGLTPTCAAALPSPRRPLTPELPRRYLLGGAGRAGNFRGIWLKIQPPPAPLRARLLRRPDPARAANAAGSFSLLSRSGRERATSPHRGQAPPLSPAGHRAAGAPPLKPGTCGQCDRPKSSKLHSALTLSRPPGSPAAGPA